MVALRYHRMRVQLWMRRSDGQTRRSWFWCAWKTVPNNFRLIWRFRRSCSTIERYEIWTCRDGCPVDVRYGQFRECVTYHDSESDFATERNGVVVTFRLRRKYELTF
jgi:hypothetical protein